MAATVQIDNAYGATPTVVNNVDRGDWISASLDVTPSPSNDLRAANPIAVPGTGTAYSFEKYHKLRWASGTATTLDTFRHYYSGGSPSSGCSLFTNAQTGTPPNDSAAAPVGTNSAKATTAYPSADPAATTFTGSLTASGQSTSYVITQLDVADSATDGFSLTENFVWNETA